MKYATELRVGRRIIALDRPTYFIADIAANHDGCLDRARQLIWLAKQAGADCAKFQHFLAKDIVSAHGFSTLTSSLSHQASWKKSVPEIYDQYHTRRDWTDILIATCREADIDFMTTPYDYEAIDMFASIVPAFKIGSGDITFQAAIKRIAKIGKPVLLATGASDMNDVEAAVASVLDYNPELCLMQCNTNYTGSLENFRYVNLNVLKTFNARWPGLVLGLSDHTPRHATVLGAITLGARVIEKHFTDDTTRDGPDHKFALNPTTWREMIVASRELEASFGDGIKRVEANEIDTVVIQRRSVRLKTALAAGSVLAASDLESLRPCPRGAIGPDAIDNVIGRRLVSAKPAGSELSWTDIE